MAVRVSQVVLENAISANANLRASQIVLETLIQTDGKVRVSQTVLEGLTYTLSKARASQIVLEVLVKITVPVIPASIPIFPTLPEGYPINLSIVMDTTVGTVKSLREVRVLNQVYPLWDIEIPLYELLDETQNQTSYAPFAGELEYTQLCQLFLQMYGQTNVFAFDCPWDDSRTNQIIGTGNGLQQEFTVYRTWGSGYTQTEAPVGLINSVSSVSVNGTVVSPTTYSVGRNSISFNTAPASGAQIEMTFTYYYLCRFVEDEQDFEEFAKNRWTVPSLKFQAVLWV